MRALGRRRSRLAILVAATAVGTLLIGAVFLTRSAGSLVRGPLFSLVEQRYGVVATARRFDLDPLRLRVVAGGVEIAARDHAADPFLTVDEVVVDLPWTAVWGGLAIDTLFLDGPAVSVVRHADGSSNLPAGKPEAPVAGGSAGDSEGTALSGGEGEPPAPDLPIRRLDVRNLSVDWRDEAAGFTFRLPAAEVHLASRGRTNVSGTAGVTWRGVTTEALSFDGEMASDGTALRLDRLTVTGAAGELTARGLVDALLGRPSIAIDYEASLDLSHLAAWVPGATASGTVAVAGSLQRAADRFALSAELSGEAVKWGRAALDRFDAALAVAPDGANVESLRLELAGGVLSASGGVDFAAGLPGRLEATWSGLDVDRLLALRGSAPPISVDAVAAGLLTARWTELAVHAVDLSARNHLAIGAPDAAVGGDMRLETEGGHWRLIVGGAMGRAVHLSGNIEAKVAAGGAGRVVDWRAARLVGDIAVHCEDVAACGPTDATLAGLRGSGTARFAVSGSLGRPEVTGVLEAPVLRVGRGALAGLTAHLVADPDAVRVTVLPVSVGPNQVRGGVEVRLVDNAVEGFLAAELADLASFGPLVPPALAPSGRGRIDVTVGGRPGQIRGDAVFGFDALEIAGRRLGPLTGWVSRDGSGRLQAALEIPDLAAGVEAEADPAGVGSFAIRGQLRDADVARLIPPAASLAMSVTGRVTGDMSATGTLADLWPASTAAATPGRVDLAGNVRIDDALLLVGDHPPLTGLQARATVRDGVVLLDELRGAWGGADVQGTAELPLELGAGWLPGALTSRASTRGRSARVRASVASLSPAVLEAYVDPRVLDDIAGGVSAVVDLEVPARGIEGSHGRLTLTEAAFEVAGVPIAQRRPTVIAVENGRAVLTAFDWGSRGNVVGMGGSLQLADLRADGWAEGDLDLRTLSALAPQLAAAGVDLGGTARLRARLTGPFGSPALRGSLEIAEGEMRVAQPRLVFTDLDGALSLDGDTVTVDQLTGTANGGPVRIDGGWRIGGTPVEKRLAITGTGMAIDFPPGLRTETDLALAIQEEEDGLALAGSATILRGAYREPITLAGGLIEALRQGSAMGRAVPDGGTRAGVQLDIRVSTGEDLVVDNNYVEAEVGGDLRIGGTTAAPALAGRIAVREGGRVRLANRVYEIDAGTVDFVDPEAIARREPGPDADGVVLTYEIVHGPRTALAVTGYDPPEDVRRDLEAIWARAVFDTFLLDELEAHVAEHLRDRGYLRAAVDARIVERPGAPPGQSAREAAAAVNGGPGAKRIEVRIDPGPRTEELRLRFEGVGTEDVRALERVVREQELKGIAWTDPERLATAIAAWHRDRGRLRATVEVGELRFVDRTAELPVRVAPGPRFRFGAIDFAGTAARPAAEVRAEAAIEEGAVYSESALAAARARILASYRRVGHTDATVTARQTMDEWAATVDVKFEVSEGPRQVVREVVVEGARRTHPALVRKALDIEPGAPVDSAAWSLARKRLYDTGVFRSVDIQAVAPTAAEARAAAGTVPVEARVRLEEWPRYRFRYGLRLVDDAALGESTGRALRLGAVGDLSRRNLWGRGLTGGVSTHAGRDQQALRAYLRMPTLLGRPIETNLFVSRRRETDHASGIGTIDVTQISAEQRTRPRAGTMLAVSASLDRSRTSDGVPLPESLVTAGWNVVRIDGSAVVDTRDNLFDPSSGLYHSSNLTYGAEVGNPRAFLKYLGQQFVHRRVGRVVLASAVRVGLATGLGAELIPTERFFAGGGNTVRGYAQDSLGPAGPGPGGIPAGGHALLILNQEVRVPLWNRFGAVGFIDAGNVFRSVRDVSLRDLRVGAGAGLRFQSPVGLLRLDYGFALPRRPDEPRGRFFVSLGQAF